MKKKLLVLGMATIMCVGLSFNAMASEAEVEETTAESATSEKTIETYPSTITTFGTSSVIENTLVYYGEKIPMYPTFEDKEAAIQDLYGQAGELLSNIETKYGLGTLSEDNWKEYLENAQEYIYSGENGVLDWEAEPQALFVFFDIYENDESNQEIIDNYNPLLKNADDELYSLPYDRENLGIQEPEIEPRGWSLSAARAYCKNFAVTPNSAGYGVFKNDCTNFASQIKFEGGFAQQYTGNINTGWWHTGDGVYNRYSTSWINADKFVKRLGTDFTTSSFSDLSYRVKAGKLIAFDSARDGGWDHVAFVYKVGKDRGSYMNLKIAQHSSNYLAWVSSSTNGWENLTNTNFASVHK